MEEDGRKKKNKKKKKTKQPSTLEDNVPIKSLESTTDNESHAAEIGQDINGQVSRATYASDDVWGKMDYHPVNGIETNIANSEKECWMDREANFQKEVEQLQSEKDAQMEKEAVLQEKVKELLKDKDENLQKLVNHEETIKLLRDENITLMQKESSLMEKLEQLMKENDVIIQKKDYLEEKIEGLQMEKDAYLQKEKGFEESIVALSKENTKLRSQVVILEELSNGLSEEKKELTEIISGLKFQINNLESAITFPHIAHNEMASENGNLDSQLEAMHALVKKSVSENPELVEKVDAALDKKDVRTVPADVSESYEQLTHDFAAGAEASRMMPVSHSMMSLEEIMVNGERNDESGCSGVVNTSKDIIESSEIVQIPLDENEVKNTSLEVAEKNDASLIDAPLIGAPFRFMSFVARYVSGADLVK